MKLNTLTIILFGAGSILIYAGIKDVSPKSVVTLSISGKSPATAAPSGASTVAPSVALNPSAQPPGGTAAV